MKIMVLGAGLLGITTAYFLVRDGHEVTVVDEHATPGMGTSHANGGQISVSHPEPWASPAVPRLLLHWLGDPHAPFRIQQGRDAELWSFGYRFLRNCTSRRHSLNTRAIARLALYSRAQLDVVREATGIGFDHGRTGTLHVFTQPREFAKAPAIASARRRLGIEQQVLDAGDCVRLEPALASATRALRGGIYAAADESGDAFLFTQALSGICAAQGVRFRYGTAVTGLEPAARRITAVHTREGRMPAEAFVVALGTGSAALMRAPGVRLPIYPIKGYSATYALTRRTPAPRINLIYEERRIVVSRLGERLRIAGGADLAGYHTAMDTGRARSILQRAFDLFPEPDAVAPQYWAGLRPMTPDGRPVLGQALFPNLYLNTGHGSLGWTLACGSSRAVADLVAGRTPALDLADYDPGRFA
jgi:D-amino-acid dehydrogenase